MTARQREVLEFLREEPGANVRRVAGEFGMRSQDAGRVLRALERKRAVRFEPMLNGECRAGWLAL